MSKPVVAVVVIVGAVPPGHLTLVNVAVLDPVPSWISFTMNEVPDVAVGMVNVQLPVNVYDKTVPEDNDKVTAVLEFAIDGAVSVQPVITGVVMLGVVCKTTAPEPVVAVVVIVGAVPPGHLTPVNVAVLEPVPSWISFTMNDVPDVAVGMVNVQLPVNVQLKTVPEDNDKVTAVLEFAIDGAVSR